MPYELSPNEKRSLDQYADRVDESQIVEAIKNHRYNIKRHEQRAEYLELELAALIPHRIATEHYVVDRLAGRLTPQEQT